jgi:hypothetical protein
MVYIRNSSVIVVRERVCHTANFFKRANDIAIPKSRKDGFYPAHYQPIWLLSMMYKLLERLILQRIYLLIEAATRVHRVGFCNHRSCTEQVMALPTHTEAGFQRQLKTEVVFANLSEAYDSVWRDGLMLKFMRTVPCAKICNLLNNMLLNRFYQVFVGNQSSQQLASIKQWFTARQRFSSDIIQPIHVGSTVVLLESVPVR